MTAPPGAIERIDMEGDAISLDRYVPLLGAEVDELRALAAPLEGREVLMVNSTRVGGGVAELLNRVVPMLEELGLRPRWEVVSGDRQFFEVTKAFHNALQGGPAALPPHAFEIFRANTESNLGRVHLDSEAVVIHDPQPAGLIDGRRNGAGHWMWRCHIDLSRPEPEVWQFLEPGCRAMTPPFFPRRNLPAGFRYRNICSTLPSIRFRRRTGRSTRSSCGACWSGLESIPSAIS